MAAAKTFAAVALCAFARTGAATDDRSSSSLTAANDDEPPPPFWINPCGYKTNDEDEDEDDPVATINRVLTLAKRCEDDADRFKRSYIRRTFDVDYKEHYRRWKDVANEWMTPRLLDAPDDQLSREWLDRRRFPDELTFTYEVLQRAAVGLELMTDDAAVGDTAESAFADELAACRDHLRQLLCEVSDDVDAEDGLRRPKDVGRDAIPYNVRHEDSTSRRNLTNSIIFRDYVIAMKYVTTVYEHFKVNRLSGYCCSRRNSLRKRGAAAAAAAIAADDGSAAAADADDDADADVDADDDADADAAAADRRRPIV